jgi:hypothetical protein
MSLNVESDAKGPREVVSIEWRSKWIGVDRHEGGGVIYLRGAVDA